MGDYINRAAAMPDRFCVGVSCQECPFCDDPIKGGCKVARFIDAIPAADVAPVRHGRWIEQPPDFDLCGVEYYRCSECGKEQQTPSHYCQFCGARMEGWKWCVWQDEDNEGVYCTAHIHEDRVLNCPYKNLGERQRADYPCQDYRPMNGGQHE